MAQAGGTQGRQHAFLPCGTRPAMWGACGLPRGSPVGPGKTIWFCKSSSSLWCPPTWETVVLKTIPGLAQHPLSASNVGATMFQQRTFPAAYQPHRRQGLGRAQGDDKGSPMDSSGNGGNGVGHVLAGF